MRYFLLQFYYISIKVATFGRRVSRQLISALICTSIIAVAICRAYHIGASPTDYGNREIETAESQHPPQPGRRRSSDERFRHLFAQSHEIPRTKLGISACVHVLRLHGINAEVQVEGDKVQILQLLTNAKQGMQYFGQPPFVRTDFGIRYPIIVTNGTQSGPFDQSHRDLCLALFAELGLPSTYRLHLTGDGADDNIVTVDSALADSIAMFHLSQIELEWTTIAYTHFLTKRSWTNRFGETTSFDDLSVELMKRPLATATCGGGHRLTALSHLLSSGMVADTTAVMITTYLQDALSVLQRTQAVDGSWTPLWVQVLDGSAGTFTTSQVDTRYNKLLATGHLNEWLNSLPAHLRPHSPLMERSNQWLQNELAASADFWDAFCPLTHALCSIPE